MKRFPDFFIVGAPKCGTSTLHNWLSQHPRLFLPSADEDSPDYWITKEPNYYAGDLGIARSRRIVEQGKYARLFKSAAASQLIGEASPSYFYSQSAVERIHADNPDAKIIIQLRNPADFVRSLHFDQVRTDSERCFDLAKALERGKSGIIPTNAEEPYLFDYLDKANFYPYAKNYIDRFGREQVLITLLSDMKNDSYGLLGKIYSHLGVENHIPTLDARNEGSYKLDDHLVGSVVTDKIPGYAGISGLIPQPLKRFGRRFIESFLLDSRDLGTMSDSLRRKILTETSDSTIKLQELTGLDLSAWLPVEIQATDQL